MPNSHIFNFVNLTTNGVYANQYKMGAGIDISSAYTSYSWDSYMQSLTYNNIFTLIKEAPHGKKSTQENITNIGYLNYNSKFLTKQQLAGIAHFKQKIKYDIIYKQPSSLDYNKAIFPLIKLFSVPVVVIQADIFGLKAFQYIPVSYRLGIKWQAKQVVINFRNMEGFLKEMIQKIPPFLATDLSLSEINNIFFNYLNLKVAKTTDPILHDILRAIFMEMFIRAVKHLDIVGLTSGILILTGEFPALLKEEAYTMLSLIDGLVLRGLWGIYIDINFNLINSLYINKKHRLEDATLLKLAIPFIDLFFSPIQVDQIPMLNLSGVKTKKYFGVSEDIVRYKVNSVFNQSFSSVGDANYELQYPLAFYIRSVIFDMRPRPIEYGPEAINNKNVVGKALYKLANFAL